MGRAICRCGQQIRTNAKSGARVQCPRCETWLTVADKVLDPDRALEEKRIGSDPGVLLRQTNARNPSEKSGASGGHHSTMGISRIVFVSLLATIPLGLVLWTYFGSASPSKKLTRIDKPDSARTTEGGSPGWEQLDASAFEKRALSPGGSLVAYQEKIPIKQIVDGLKTIPFDTVSKTAEIAHCRWDVLRAHRGPESIEVLVRYFQEPMSISELIMSDEWISGRILVWMCFYCRCG
ncbi:MAG: hypothetical protein ACKO3V_17545 [Pirellula sp.]